MVFNRALGRFERFRRRNELDAIVRAFDSVLGIEIGGPSELFADHGLLPIYGAMTAYDAANFAASTPWDGQTRVKQRPRRTFLAEATDLGVPDETYGGLLASHVLEHVANPVRALREWRRVVVAGGPLLVAIPHRDYTFDHRRAATPLSHLLEDERKGVTEDDLTHVREVLAYHDSRHDHFDGTPEQFADRCRDNLKYRALHHHVFVTRTAVELVLAADLDVELVTARRPHHIVLLARRSLGEGPPRSPNNLTETLRASAFPSDRAET